MESYIPVGTDSCHARFLLNEVWPLIRPQPDGQTACICSADTGPSASISKLDLHIAGDVAALELLFMV